MNGDHRYPLTVWGYHIDEITDDGVVKVSEPTRLSRHSSLTAARKSARQWSNTTCFVKGPVRVAEVRHQGHRRELWARTTQPPRRWMYVDRTRIVDITLKVEGGAL
ncbi:MAG: hypothetical protein AAFV53_27120 [Myxococcota bacterium]